jgi:hypothetical protein
VVGGQVRTSIVVDPPDGRVPLENEVARKRLATARASATSTSEERQGATRQAGTSGLSGAFDNPEQRPLSERCLLGFGSTSGPPALPDYFYNDLHQIVQTSDSVLILSEMVHDARIVRMNAQHLPNNIRRWMGFTTFWSPLRSGRLTCRRPNGSGIYWRTDRSHRTLIVSSVRPVPYCGPGPAG